MPDTPMTSAATTTGDVLRVAREQVEIATARERHAQIRHDNAQEEAMPATLDRPEDIANREAFAALPTFTLNCEIRCRVKATSEEEAREILRNVGTADHRVVDSLTLSVGPHVEVIGG